MKSKHVQYKVDKCGNYTALHGNIYVGKNLWSKIRRVHFYSRRLT